MKIKTKVLLALTSIVVVSNMIFAILGVTTILNTSKNAQKNVGNTIESQVEDFLVQITTLEAEKNNAILERISKRTENMARYIGDIFDNGEIYAKETVWKFDEHVFKGEGGQYLNSKDDTSSIFIPNYADINSLELRKELETSSHLDYIFPHWLKNDKNIVAEWMTGINESSRYYPNIDLGNIVEPNYKATEDVFYQIATPRENPNKETVWTPVYDDPAGKGLMVTASAPIYTKNGFVGVLGSDVTLELLGRNIEQKRFIKESYSFLIDQKGFSISLPEEAYPDFFDEKPTGDKKYSLDLSGAHEDIRPIIEKMKSGQSGFGLVEIDHENHKESHYIAYAPLKTSGFSVGTVISKDVALIAVKELKEATDRSTSQMIYIKFLPISIFIFIVVFILSIFFANYFSQPLKSLSDGVERISTGNFDIKINPNLIKSKDEIGQLSRSFDQMTGKLKKSQEELKQYSQGLETKVEERTAELEKAKEQLEEKLGELERFNKLAVDRELKMVELKKKIKELEIKINNNNGNNNHS